MAAVFTLSFANLRKKKVHNGLIGLLILLSTLLLATSVTVILNTTNLFTEMHQKTEGSHEMLLLRDELHDAEQVYQWWDQQDGVSISPLIPYRLLAGMSVQGEEASAQLSSLTLYMMETPVRPSTVNELIFAQGEETEVPEQGKAWVPTSIAYLYDLSVGDTLEFSTGRQRFNLEISALVIDVPYGAPFATDARIWMNPVDYVHEIQGVQGTEQYMLGLRYADYNQSRDYWDQFEEDMEAPFLESKMSFEEMSSFYLIMNKAIGFIMIFLGIVMVLVAIFTIRFTISDEILQSYRTIGVIKALGLTSTKMASIYMLQYSIISLVSIIPGVILSQFVSNIIVHSALSSFRDGVSNSGLGGGFVAVSAGMLVFVLINLCVYLYANRARRIEPMQAIRYGMSEADNSKMNKRLSAAHSRVLSFGKAPLLIVIGLKNLIKNKKASILIVLLSMIMSAVLVLGFVLLYSISNIQQTSASWGYDTSDISLRVVNASEFSRTEFEERMSTDSRIKNIGWLGYVNGVVSSKDDHGAVSELPPSVNFNIYVLDGSYDEVGYTNISGRNPHSPNEISIGMNVAKQLNKEAGDVVEVYINGHKHTLLISGIFQSIANQSISARITADTLYMNNPGYNEFIAAFINLNDDQSADLVTSEINEKYKTSATAATMQTLLDATFKQAVSSLILPMSLMGLLFTGVTIIIIYSISRISIRKESKTYGIYKSIGLSSRRIRSSITLGIVFISGIGALAGILLGVFVLPLILGSLLSDYGITDLPLILNWWGIIDFACITLISAGIGSWASTRVVAATSPRILVID